MADPWSEIFKRLADRDKVEKRDSEYYQAFAQLSRLLSLSDSASTDRIVKENAHLWEENELLITRLNLQTIRLESADLRAKELTKAIRDQDAQAVKLQNKISLLTQQLVEKNKLLEIVNDEHLISQIQQNVLKDRVGELERELGQLKLTK
ncbi:hypothetical protein HF325_006446 [Metschnikowia pulcherrima]|uniref:Autophagy-related protein 16 domain-containing protein n=1 Tax=Metschnikowia pulcherrima TaxID=27326 RepID=A0A8H7GK51_9ASCO|nr:hypothetical protein HF325_006446 [Metschnikowia pulcherrima]